MPDHPVMMAPYHDLMRRCLEEGEPVAHERTGEKCYTLVGEQLKFDLSRGFPAITTKKLAWKSAVGELLGILQGATSAAQFRALGCKVWDTNANVTPAWLTNPHRAGEDDIGRTYGAQWTDWTDMRVITAATARALTDQMKQMVNGGWEFVSSVRSTDIGCSVVVRRGINQVEDALRTILTNPTDRRIVINGWRPDEHDRTALPVCHMTYTFVPNTRTRRLDLVMHQRSWDVFLAFNIPICALFLHIMARLSGFNPGVVTMQIANAHVYEAHVEQARVQLSREHYVPPKLLMSDDLQPVTADEVAGAFHRLRPEMFALEGYQHHPALSAPMAA